MATQQPDWKEVGHIGDKSWLEYSGGPVFVDKTGVYEPELEYVEPPSDDVELDDPDATWTIYRVVLDQEVPDWGDVKDVAKSAGMSAKELREAFISDDPMERAWAYETWAGYYGWREFDSSPLNLTRESVEKRYNTEI